MYQKNKEEEKGKYCRKETEKLVAEISGSNNG
jgi:hypothetical protein